MIANVVLEFAFLDASVGVLVVSELDELDETLSTILWVVSDSGAGCSSDC